MNLPDNPFYGALIATACFIFLLIVLQAIRLSRELVQRSEQHADLEQRLGLALRYANMGMFEHENGAEHAMYDQGMINMYGLNRPPGLVPVSEWLTLIHADDLPAVTRALEQTWSSDNMHERIDFRAVLKDGSEKYIRANWVTELDENDHALRFIGVHSDLTDIREKELKQQSTSEHLAVISASLPGVVYQRELEDGRPGKLVYVSESCRDIWGYEDHEIYADPDLLARAHDPGDHLAFLAAVKKCGETGERFSHRFSITARDGTTRWLDFHGGRTLRDKSTVRVDAIIIDVTREVDRERQAELDRTIAARAQKQESIGYLTGGVAHDFNNLLAVILGNLELLKLGSNPDRHPELISAAMEATLRGAELTQNMLAFARRASLDPVVVDLNDIIRVAKNWISRTLPESVLVDTSLLALLWRIKVDRSSLESAILNLMLNARDAMAGVGKLTIETANVRIDESHIDNRGELLSPGRYVMLAVTDTGPGIPSDVLDSIFEPFFTTKPPGAGTGLGLSMVFGFMRQTGGTVQVYTEIGEGTTFKLYFPASEEETQAAVPVKATISDDYSTNHTILLAEDEEAVRVTLVAILEQAGYGVTAAVSGDQARKVLESDSSYDLLLTDIVMPGELQGTSLSKALREKWPELPVVFMSGYASEATVHGNGLRPGDIRLMKPVQRADLLLAVAKAIAAGSKD